MSSTRDEWFSNTKQDLLAGTVVALALIPEAIAFSMIAGVDPKVGLYASFSIAVMTAFTGGRPGMISAATGAMALLMVTLVKQHGLDYLLATTVLTGILQVIAGYARLGELMRFVSQSVVVGFVNALAILIFMAQLPELTDVSWHVYAMTAAGLGIIYGLPRLTTAVPSPLIAIVTLTLIAIGFNLDIRTVGDMGELPNALPTLFVPNIPYTFETLTIIFPYSVTLMMVGLLESLMTATIVDELTDTQSDKNKECVGQGLANIVTGFIGGMAGCAMIGQSVINVTSGGRGRLSTLFAGVLLLILVVFLGDWVRQIPMAALVAVMIMVSIGTFNWGSIKNVRTYPKSSSAVMLATVAVTVFTHDLGLGVLTGVLLSGFFFAYKVGKILTVRSQRSESESVRTYKIYGQLFFASADRLVLEFDYQEPLEKVIIDLSYAHLWDVTAVKALDKVAIKFKKSGVSVELIGMNPASESLIDQFAMYRKEHPEALALGH